MNRSKVAAATTAAALLVFASIHSYAADNEADFSWSTGVEYASGTYGGTVDIEDLYIPITGRVEFERVSLALTLPYLSVRAPLGTIVTGPDGEPLPGSGEIVTESGPGDVIAALTVYNVIFDADRDVALDITGAVKFGTADAAKGLGTGEQDYTVRADLYRFFAQATLLASAGYKFRGDPSGTDLEDVWLGSLGTVWLPDDRSSMGLIFDYRESSIAGGDDVSELSAFFMRELSDAFALQVYAFTGFSDASADWGAGVQFCID